MFAPVLVSSGHKRRGSPTLNNMIGAAMGAKVTAGTRRVGARYNTTEYQSTHNFGRRGDGHRHRNERGESLAAASARYDKHRRIARWTLPIWLLVSVTGVVVYGMLYHMA